MQQDSGETSLKPTNTAPNSGNPSPQQPQIITATATAPVQENLQCPRCNSTNTKFCYYYNNRNLSQARHFCKSCRRFWIKWTPDSVDRRYLNPLPVPLVLTPDPENLPCPRCNSANTKFYRYNYYNLSKPRYFCRACRRSWTKGGILMDMAEGSGVSRRSGRRSGRRADPEPVGADWEVRIHGDGDCEAPVVGDLEAPVEGLREGNQKGQVEEGLGEPFLNGWSIGREEGSGGSGSAGFEEMGFGRPV